MPATNECIDWSQIRAQVTASQLRWLSADPGTAIAPDHRLPTADEFWTYLRTLDENPYDTGRVLNWGEMLAHRQLLLSGGAARFVVPAGSYTPWQSALMTLNNDDWTMELWVRYAEGASVWVASTNPDGTTGAGFAIGVTGNHFRACFGSRYGTTTQTVLFDGGTRTPDTWYHVALTRVEATGVVTLYVNGTAVASSSASYDVDAFVQLRLFLGSAYGSAPKTQLSTSGATVDLDELRLWGVARTPAELVAAAQEVPANPTTDLDHFLRFEGDDTDETTGTTARVSGAAVDSYPTDTAF